jgi:hypothetical protein
MVLLCLLIINPFRWIYQLILSEDANFKMKGRNTSSRADDPTLGPGWAYMVASDEYLQHLSQYVNQDEVRRQFYLV